MSSNKYNQKDLKKMTMKQGKEERCLKKEKVKFQNLITANNRRSNMREQYYDLEFNKETLSRTKRIFEIFKIIRLNVIVLIVFIVLIVSLILYYIAFSHSNNFFLIINSFIIKYFNVIFNCIFIIIVFNSELMN